jgi:hypothetical protein
MPYDIATQFLGKMPQPQVSKLRTVLSTKLRIDKSNENTNKAISYYMKSHNERNDKTNEVKNKRKEERKAREKCKYESLIWKLRNVMIIYQNFI